MLTNLSSRNHQWILFPSMLQGQLENEAVKKQKQKKHKKQKTTQ